MVMVNVCVDESSPPLDVPPSSLSTTVTVATPDAPAAGVYVSVPVAGLIVGCVLNRVLLLLVSVKIQKLGIKLLLMALYRAKPFLKLKKPLKKEPSFAIY